MLEQLRTAYLDLMRDSLIGRLNEEPALPAGKVEGYRHDFREQGWDWPSKAPSMIGARRMQNVRSECERALREGVPGDFMEAGIWRGGASMMMRAVLKAYGIADRRVFAADSFAGFPTPAEGSPDFGFELVGHPEFAIPLHEVKAAFARYGLLDEQVVFLEGLFKDTLPGAPVEALAVLRLDGDMYESTRDCLEHLYHKLSPGGALIVDDYFLFETQRRAVDEFRVAHGIEDPIVQVDHFGGYWTKT
ncbi:MAG TPA: TylF/MycF/NovP-related O-methyltransferase [Hyphomicrobiaceae bacterium]|jgi:O-methyltransferase/8-demethyl-8-(2,3-dimethoxy-alpha-L-rhamnosyl)tetracenomycin-C 4'-O-methyltransferase